MEKDENSEATGITIPFDVEKIFGAKHVPVKVSINGVEHRSLIVRRGEKYVMIVPKRFRAAVGVRNGKMITIVLEKDNEKRVVTVPEDFAEVLEKMNLTEVFAKMSYTHQKEYVQAIEEAKKEETRVRRIGKAIEQLTAKMQ